MALKTMMVIQRESGRKVTINVTDFDTDKYALESEVIQEAKAAPSHAPEPEPQVTNFEVAEPAEEEQPRRRRGRG